MVSSSNKIQRQRQQNEAQGIEVDVIYTSSSSDEEPAIIPVPTFVGVWETIEQHRQRMRARALEAKRLARYNKLMEKIKKAKEQKEPK